MWYRSIFTNKIIRDTSFYTLDNICGNGTAERFIDQSILIPVENPSVIDILWETGSDVLAAARYREIHDCSLKEAVEGVKILKKDMYRFHRKARRKKK